MCQGDHTNNTTAYSVDLKIGSMAANVVPRRPPPPPPLLNSATQPPVKTQERNAFALRYGVAEGHRVHISRLVGLRDGHPADQHQQD
jgi:hypothetical protein